jgi:methanogenic corrinoid protein MtbC1
MHYETALSSFAAQLRALRIEKDLKQKDIAEALGVSQSTIANYEQGIRFPDEEMLKGLARFLRVTADELLGLPDASRLGPGTSGDSVPKTRELEVTYRDAILDRRFAPAREILIDGLSRGIPLSEVFGRIVQPVLVDIGTRWEHGEITAVWEHLYTEEIRRHIDIVTHYAREKPNNGIRLVSAAVGGEMHVLGIRMISDLLETEGFKVFFLGTNAPAAELIRLCLKEAVDILALSVTMDYHINALSSLIGAVRSEPPLAGMKIIIGGNAVNRDPRIRERTGADGYSPDIESILEEIERLLGPGRSSTTVSSGGSS